MIFPFVALVLGLLGSLHCVGMCGPIALAVPYGAKSFWRIFAYNFGRATTYALLGALTGLAGHSVQWFAGQQLLSILAGAIILAVLLTGFFGKKFRLPFVEKNFAWFRKIFGRLLQQRKMVFAIGLLNGLLPCGLVYAGLAGAAASGTLANGALFMFIFGLGTFPAMMTLALAGNKLSFSFREKLRKAVPVFVGIMAVLLILRGLGLGIPYLSPVMDHGHAVCCTHCRH